MAMAWIDKYGRKGFRPHGRRLRNLKEYSPMDQTYYRLGDRTDVAPHPDMSSPASHLQDYDMVRFSRSPGQYGVEKMGRSGREVYDDTHHSRLIKPSELVPEEGYEDYTSSGIQKDIGGYERDYVPTTKVIDGKLTDVRTIETWQPEAVDIRHENETRRQTVRDSTREERERMKRELGFLGLRGF